MLTSDRFLRLVRFGRKCSALVGMDIMNPDFRYSWVTITVASLGLIFVGLTAYSAHDGLFVQGDVTLMLQAFCTLGCDLYGLSKLFTALLKKDDLRKLVNLIEGIYCEYEKKHAGYKRVLRKSIHFISTLTNIVAATYILVVLFIGCAPALLYLIYRKPILLMQLLLPGVDASTSSGYIITIIYQIVCLMFGSFGNFAADLIFFLLVLHASMLKDIFKLKFQDLNENLLNTRDKKQSLAMLRDIVQWHQEYSNFTQMVSDIFFVVIFVQIFTSAFSIAMTVFIIFFGDWPGGPAYLLYSFVVLYGYCILGSVIEKANENVCDDIYNTCLWYEMPAEQRKILMVMFIKAQNPTPLTVGDIMPLSVVTGLSVTKAIYSFMMMLINVTAKE